MRPVHELRLNEAECELSLYANGYYVFGFKLNELQTSTDVLRALWQFSSEHPNSPALVGAAIKSLRTLLVGRNEGDKLSTRFGFKPAPLDKWKGTRVGSSSVLGSSSKSE